MTTWEKLVTGDELETVVKRRKTINIQKKIENDLVQSYLNNGWSEVRTYANGYSLVEKPKPVGDAFEDEVWMMFYKMGFKVMNDGRDFKLEYSSGLTKQIDVVAIDDDSCLLVECKATSQEDYNHNWKTDLEAINGNQQALFNEIKKRYPNRKCKYIFATKNYVIGSQDTERMKNFKIANFDYDTIQYYEQLVNHLGHAAKYQLLGSLFVNVKIPNLQVDVPAVEGKMGNLTYYTFLIEPSRLLKIAYILHRNKSNRSTMQTYQRLIKKERLKAIREFVNQGGYFPNSLIVSINSDKGVKFDLGSPKVEGVNSKIGILHLPQNYQSVYVIDGQHRLYGYSETKWADKNSIPVVAFVNLPGEEQVKMFMDINQNQKPVSKALRNTLNIDLLWDSPLFYQRNEALMLHIGQSLGEDPSSPLYGRVVIGEDTQSGKRCITLEYIKEAIKQSNFLSTYKRKSNEELTVGPFSKENNDKTFDLLYAFLKKGFQYVKDNCRTEWDKGQEGFLTINNCTYALIRIFGDIADIVLSKNGGTAKVSDANSFYDECKPLLDSLSRTLNTLDAESINAIKNSKGGGAKKVSWRSLQVALHNADPSFTNEELEQYIQENCTNNNDISSTYLDNILSSLKAKLWDTIPNKDQWLYVYLPDQARLNILHEKVDKNYNRRKQGITDEVSEWDCVSFKDISEFIRFGDNWSSFVQNAFKINGSSISKTGALSLIKDLASYRDKLSNSKKIVNSEYEQIKKIYDSYVNTESQNSGEDSSNGTNS